MVTQIKKIGGATFVDKTRGGPLWRVPATLETYLRLREHFDESELHIDAAIRKGVRQSQRDKARLRKLARATDAELTTLPDLHPALYQFIKTRPYQLADIAFMAASDNPMNFNEPGTGKTVETIGAVLEAGLDEGPVLVVCPKTACEVTWGDTLAQWLPDMPVYVPEASEAVLQDVKARALAGQPCWVVVNPEYFKQRSGDDVLKGPKAWIYHTVWHVIVLDEFHRMGLSNPKTNFRRSVKKLRSHKRFCLSGTPLGGQPIRLWGVLNFLYPEDFPSKWAFAKNWLALTEIPAGSRTFTKIGDVLKHRRKDFNLMMDTYMVRRTKKEVMPWLPDKQYEVKWARMTKAQRKQYEQWEQNTEIEIDEEQLDAISILAVYTRLQQFAFGVLKVEYLDEEETRFALVPTRDSPKLPLLWGDLEELGIPQGEGTEKMVIFSQYTNVINETADWLRTRGVKVGVIKGGVKQSERTRLIRDFQQKDDMRVMLMNTKAGGVSITLDRANTVGFLDETWDPDDQTQSEDRCHRGTKTDQVRIIRYLTKDTIEERKFKGNISKDKINKRVLDREKRSKPLKRNKK